MSKDGVNATSRYLRFIDDSGDVMTQLPSRSNQLHRNRLRVLGVAAMSACLIATPGTVHAQPPSTTPSATSTTTPVQPAPSEQRAAVVESPNSATPTQPPTATMQAPAAPTTPAAPEPAPAPALPPDPLPAEPLAVEPVEPENDDLSSKTADPDPDFTPTENPKSTVVPGQMRSDREEVPAPFTKADADKAETMEAKTRAQRANQRAAFAAPGCQVYWPSPHEVCGAIRDKYNALGGPGSFLSFPNSPEYTNPNNTGKRTQFLNGPIYWSAATGAHPVVNSFLNRWGVHQYSMFGTSCVHRPSVNY